MKSAKIIELLKSLDEKEMEEFELFIKSPYLRYKPQVIKLFSILKKYYPGFSQSIYSKQTVFTELYPYKQFNPALLNGYYCLLSNSLTDYLQHAANKKNQMRAKIDLLNEFRERGLNFDFNRLAKKIESELLNQKFDITIFYSIFFYQTSLINYKAENIHSNKVTEISKLFEDYNKFILYLTNIFISEYLNAKICFYNDGDSFTFKENNFYKKIDNRKILTHLLTIIRGQNPFEFVHNLNLAYLHLLENPSDKNAYFLYKEQILLNQNRFKNDEIELHLNFLKTYCIDKCYELGQREQFTREYIDIEFHILYETLFQNTKTKYLQNRSFRNLVLFLANKKETARLNELLEFCKYLHPSFRTEYKKFALAYFNYCDNNQSETLKILKRIKVSDKQLALDCCLLKLKVLFDLKDYDTGFDKIQSTRKIINKNPSINFERKKRYRIFVNYLEKLFRRMEKEDEAGLNVLFKEILNKNNILYSEWFTEKYFELFGGKYKKSS